jgi:hypothetical protein
MLQQKHIFKAAKLPGHVIILGLMLWHDENVYLYVYYLSMLEDIQKHDA